MFYFCRQDLFNVNGIIEIDGHTETTGNFLWTRGHKFEENISEQVLMLNPEYGDKLPAFFDTTVPVMSDEMIAKLISLGVDNFDQYPVVLKRMDNGETFSGYKMVNFIGKIDAVDYEKSGMVPRARQHYGAIHIDAEKTKGIKAFRLKRGTDLLVVNEDVAKGLMEENFLAVLLQPTEQYTGT